MGILTKVVEVRWHPRNKKWYEDKGYAYTCIGNSFNANISDLPNKAHVRIDVACDECHQKTHINWRDYTFIIEKHDGKYYCKKCSSNLFGKIKKASTSLENSISFKDWCIKNQKTDVLELWDYYLNKTNPSKITYSSRSKYYFKCPRGIHKSQSKYIYGITYRMGNIYCNECKSFAQWGIDNICDDFLEKYWDYNKNSVNPYKISYACKSKVFIKCQSSNNHNNYNLTCGNFVGGQRCPDCSRERDESYLQEKVRLYLSEKLGYKLNHEHGCSIVPVNPKTNRPLPFDNEVIDLKLIIEVHGAQHYNEGAYTGHWSPKNMTATEVLEKRKVYDKYKKDFAESNGYFYLEIPYWTEKNDKYKILIDEKVNKIFYCS